MRCGCSLVEMPARYNEFWSLCVDWRHRMIANLQALRAIAAFAVVFYHIGDYQPTELHWFSRVSHLGAAGVDVFFVLSGFIMMFTTKRESATAADFLIKRIKRIVPTYWLVTLVTFVMLLAGLKPLGNHEADVGYLLASLLFIPVERGGAGALPLVAVGWTLNFEMFFYLVFALALSVGGVARRSWLVALSIAGCVALGAVLAPTNAALRAFTSPLMLEFVFGIGLAYLWERRSKLQPSSALGFALIGLGVLALGAVLFGARPETMTGQLRFVWFGLPAVSIVFGSLVLEAARRSVTNRLWLLQGDASYSLYLIHPLVLQVGRKVIGRVPLEGSAGASVRIVLLVCACAVCGTLFYRYVERPLTAWLSRTRAPVAGVPRRSAG